MSDLAEGAVDFDLSGARVWVAGHRGMAGSAVVRRLASERCEILTASHDELDLTRQADTERWVGTARPDVVVIAAAKVGGIYANATAPVDFLEQNLAIALNVIGASHTVGVRKLLFLGSSCIYPKLAPQPISEDALLTGPLEPTNEWYALAKIAGVKLCQAYRLQHGADFISAQPTNLYGPNDNYDPQSSHVLPALIAKIDAAKRRGDRAVTLWGSRTPRREFLHVDDAADAAVFLLRRYSGPTPLGTGQDIAILDLAKLIAEIVGWEGEFVLDPTKPDGTPRKLLDVSRIHSLGWTARIGLRQGIADAYADFRRRGERG
jgi:GDP-L-fucose synthase